MVKLFIFPNMLLKLSANSPVSSRPFGITSTVKSPFSASFILFFISNIVDVNPLETINPTITANMAINIPSSHTIMFTSLIGCITSVSAISADIIHPFLILPDAYITCSFFSPLPSLIKSSVSLRSW